MKNPLVKARKWARENPLTARDSGVADAIAEIRRIKAERAAMLRACRTALHWLRMTQETLAEGGDGGAGEYGENEMCAEAQALSPAIRCVARAIKQAEEGGA